MLHNLLLALNGLYVGRTCRKCGDAVVASDHFGVSEGVCPACRT